MSDRAPSFSDLDENQIDELVEAIRRAPDEYAKMDAMEPYVSWEDRRRLLWELTRTGALPTWEEPALWSELANGLAWASSEDVVALLRNIETYDSDQHRSFRLVEYWPTALDELAIRAYAEDPEPFDEHWEEFPEPVHQGFELVLRRFGELDRDELSTDVVDALARQHASEGLPMRALLVRDGEPEEVQLHDHSGAKPALYQFIELFGDRERWNERLLQHALSAEFGPPFHRSRDAWRAADLEELETLLSSGDIPPETRPGVYQILVGERDDEPEELFELARALSGDGFSGVETEIAAVAAILKAKKRGEPVPDDIAGRLTFRSVGRPTRIPDYYGLRRLVEAVEYLPREQAAERVRELFDQQFSRLAPFAVLRAFTDDEELMERAFDVAREASTAEGADFVSMHPVAYGLALAGSEVLQDVEEAFDEAEEPLLRDTYRRAIVHLLAERVKRGQGVPEKWNRFLSYVDWESAETDDYNFGHFIVDDLNAIVANLPEERAERLITEQLRSESDHWPRALEAIQHHPTDALLSTVFERLDREGIPSTGGSFDWLDRFLQSMPESEYGQLGSALAESSSPELHNSVQRVFGDERYDSFLEDHGAHPSADMSPVEEIERLAETAAERDVDFDWVTIYLLERSGRAPEEHDVNRVRGAPVGVDDDAWPHREGEKAGPMEHVVTLDLSTVPAIQDRTEASTEAVALFVRDPEFNEAWSPHNDDAEVLQLDSDDLETGVYGGALPAGDREQGERFEVRSVDVPSAIFQDPYQLEPTERDPVVERIRETVYQASARVGGEPIWVQDEQYRDGAFLFQFDEQFAEINLGDLGVMYVFADTAFWQCH